LIERHRRLAVRCPSCGTLVVAAVPDAAKGTQLGSGVWIKPPMRRTSDHNRSCPPEVG
jgi:hypothetical protein